VKVICQHEWRNRAASLNPSERERETQNLPTNEGQSQLGKIRKEGRMNRRADSEMKDERKRKMQRLGKTGHSKRKTAVERWERGEEWDFNAFNIFFCSQSYMKHSHDKCTAYRNKINFMLIKIVTIFRKYFQLWKQPLVLIDSYIEWYLAILSQYLVVVNWYLPL